MSILNDTTPEHALRISLEAAQPSRRSNKKPESQQESAQRRGPKALALWGREDYRLVCPPPPTHTLTVST